MFLWELGFEVCAAHKTILLLNNVKECIQIGTHMYTVTRLVLMILFFSFIWCLWFYQAEKGEHLIYMVCINKFDESFTLVSC